MKTTLYSLLVVIILSSCASGWRYSHNKKLSHIPTFSHNGAIDVFVAGEKIEKPYFKVQALEITSDNRSAFSDKVAILKRRARVIGADGVIVLSHNVSSHTYSSVGGINTTADIRSTMVKNLVAVAIKYIENVDYLSMYIKQERISKFNTKTDKYEFKCSVQLTPYHEVLKHEGDIFLYDKFVKPYKIYHLVEEMNSNWLAGFDYHNNRNYRKHYIGSKKDKVCYLEFYNGRVQNIDINYSNGTNDLVGILYDDHNRIKSKQICINEKQFLGEKLEYDEEGKLISKVILKRHAGKFRPFLKVDYTYYRNEDISELITN